MAYGDFDEPQRPEESNSEYRARRIVGYVEFLLLNRGLMTFTGRRDETFFWRDLDALAGALGLNCPCIRDRKIWVLSGMEDPESHVKSESYQVAELARARFVKEHETRPEDPFDPKN